MCIRDSTGPYLQQRWQELGEHSLVGESRGVGFLGALELVSDKLARARYPNSGKVGGLCRDISIKNGLVMRAVGDTMIISPPLVANREHIDELVDKAKLTLDQTLEHIPSIKFDE